MFTGIIEELATVKKIEKDGSNIHFTFKCSFANELRVDQSVAHNGVCLTVVEIEEDRYRVTAIEETLKRTNLGLLTDGDEVNVERCTKVGDRLDGHIVQGHVDSMAQCDEVNHLDGSTEFVFHYNHDDITVPKGSITVNGVSLTVVRSEHQKFSVHIIPHTLENTNFKNIKPSDFVNVEFDIVGKYVHKLFEKQLEAERKRL